MDRVKCRVEEVRLAGLYAFLDKLRITLGKVVREILILVVNDLVVRPFEDLGKRMAAELTR